MKELMTHVERILRPVHVVASRKLRMRREMLAHLQAAIAGNAVAVPTMNQHCEPLRFDVGSDLTRELQTCVPWIEWRLMMSLPIPRALAQVEIRRRAGGGSMCP